MLLVHLIKFRGTKWGALQRLESRPKNYYFINGGRGSDELRTVELIRNIPKKELTKYTHIEKWARLHRHIRTYCHIHHHEALKQLHFVFLWFVAPSDCRVSSAMKIKKKKGICTIFDYIYYTILRGLMRVIYYVYKTLSI